MWSIFLLTLNSSRSIIKLDQSGLKVSEGGHRMIRKEIDLNNEKVIKIINAAFEEFAKFGKTKASLNKILKMAGISKGVFYHYFSDKEELFNYLLKYSTEIGIFKMNESIDWTNDDIIKRIFEITTYKLEVIREHPYMIAFSEGFNSDVLSYMDKNEMDHWRKKVYSYNISIEKLKDPSTLEEAIHISRWTFRGLFANLMKENEGQFSDEALAGLIKKCEHYYLILSQNFNK